MSATLRDEKTPATLWPLEWFGDEKFWRDVCSKVTSALIVAIIIWGAGILLGFFQNPKQLATVVIVFSMVVYTLMYGSAMIQAIRRRRWKWLIRAAIVYSIFTGELGLAFFLLVVR